MSKKWEAVFVVSVAINLAWGVASAAPLAMNAKGTVVHCLSQGHATAIMAILKTSAGPEFEEKFDLGPGGYKDANLEGSWIHKVAIEECASEMLGQTTAEFPGDWQPN